MEGPDDVTGGAPADSRLEGKGYITQPSRTALTTKPPNTIAAELELAARVVPEQHGKDERDEEREHDEQEQVAGHAYLRPSAMSQASMTTSRLSSPATIRKALPYS